MADTNHCICVNDSLGFFGSFISDEECILQRLFFRKNVIILIFSFRSEDLLYAKFVRDITEEVLRKGVYTNRALKTIFHNHIEAHKKFLNLVCIFCKIITYIKLLILLTTTFVNTGLCSPWKRHGKDFAGPMHGPWYFIVADAFTKWVDIESTQIISTECVI